MSITAANALLVLAAHAAVLRSHATGAGGDGTLSTAVAALAAAPYSPRASPSPEERGLQAPTAEEPPGAQSFPLASAAKCARLFSGGAVAGNGLRALVLVANGKRAKELALGGFTALLDDGPPPPERGAASGPDGNGSNLSGGGVARWWGCCLQALRRWYRPIGAPRRYRVGALARVPYHPSLLLTAEWPSSASGAASGAVAASERAWVASRSRAAADPGHGAKATTRAFANGSGDESGGDSGGSDGGSDGPDYAGAETQSPMMAAQAAAPPYAVAFEEGDRVAWQGAGQDLPLGTVGVVTKVRPDGDVEVAFPPTRQSSQGAASTCTVAAARLALVRRHSAGSLNHTGQRHVRRHFRRRGGSRPPTTVRVRLPNGAFGPGTFLRAVVAAVHPEGGACSYTLAYLDGPFAQAGDAPPVPPPAVVQAALRKSRNSSRRRTVSTTTSSTTTHSTTTNSSRSSSSNNRRSTITNSSRGSVRRSTMGGLSVGQWAQLALFRVPDQPDAALALPRVKHHRLEVRRSLP